MGTPEAYIASLLVQIIGPFVRAHRLGLVTGPDGMYRMIHGNIREPDCSFTVRARLTRPNAQVSGWCPDFCIEVLSPDNTRAEMARKRREYFPAGCRLVSCDGTPTGPPGCIRGAGCLPIPNNII